VSHWEKTVETLILSHKQISRIDNVTLEQFVNLRKLQLVDNGISKIEGLGRCKLLEELNPKSLGEKVNQNTHRLYANIVIFCDMSQNIGLYSVTCHRIYEYQRCHLMKL
jgi:hypothetical protein